MGTAAIELQPQVTVVIYFYPIKEIVIGCNIDTMSNSARGTARSGVTTSIVVDFTVDNFIISAPTWSRLHVHTTISIRTTRDLTVLHSYMVCCTPEGQRVHVTGWMG